MPTSLDRIQCLLQPDTFAKVRTLCNVTGKTRSNMAAELIEAALKAPKYRELLDGAEEAAVVQPKKDPRTQGRQANYHRQPSARPISTEEERRAAMQTLGIEMPSDEEAERQAREAKKEMLKEVLADLLS